MDRFAPHSEFQTAPKTVLHSHHYVPVNPGADTLRVGDELRIPGVPVHVMTYVAPLGPYGEDVLDAPKGTEARLVHLVNVLSRGNVLLGARGPESYDEQRTVRYTYLAHATPRSVLTVNTSHPTFARESRKAPNFGALACSH
jgi:hypothetical protein